MLQYFSTITCDKCLKQLKIRITREDFHNTVGSIPAATYNSIRENDWVDLPGDKYLCPTCTESYNKMMDRCDKIKQEYWGK
jgi:hypothetical protein